MAWLRRSRFRNRDTNNPKNIAVSTAKPKNPNKPKSHLCTTTSNNSKNNTNTNSHYPKNTKVTPKVTTTTTTTPSTTPNTTSIPQGQKLLPKDKHHRRFFSFLKRKDRPSRPHTSPYSPQSPQDDVTYDGTVETMDMSGMSTTSESSNTNNGRVYLLPMNNPNLCFLGDECLPALSTEEEEEEADTDLNFRRGRAQDNGTPPPGTPVPPPRSTTRNWNEGLEANLLGSVISPRQGSDISQISAFSRRGSESSGWSGKEDSTRSGGSRKSSIGAVSTGDDSGSVSSGSIQSDQLDTLRRLYCQRSQLAAIPDTSFHSTVTEDVRCPSSSSKPGSMQGNSRHGNGSGSSSYTKESMKLTLLQRTAPIEGDYVKVAKPAPVYAPKFHQKSRSFLEPVPQEQTSFLSQSPHLASAPVPPPPPPSFPPPTQEPSSSGSLPMDTMPLLPDLEPAVPRPVTPTESLAQDTPMLSSPPEPETNPLTVPEPIICSKSLVPLTLDRDLSEDAEDAEDDGEESQFHLPTDLSIDVESLVHAQPDQDLDLEQEQEQDPTHEQDQMDLSLSPLPSEPLPESTTLSFPHTIEPLRFHPGTPDTPSSPTSSKEDVGHSIRKSLLCTHMFDSDYEQSSTSGSNSYSRDSSPSPSPSPYQRLDSKEDKSTASSSQGSSSYHFCNMPQELQCDHASKRRGEREDSADSVDSDDSEVANADDEDINALEELYVDMFGNDVDELEKDALMQPAHVSETEDPTGAYSMLGLFKDDKSCHSSVVSFDSTEFMEDEQYDDLNSRSKASCSISMHDITTIHEENEDDIAEEVDEDLHMKGVMHHAVNLPVPLLNGELHLRRQELLSQGTTTSGCTGTFSSVTDDSYIGCMSFDSGSSISSKGNTPKQVQQRKQLMGMDDFVAVPSPNVTQTFNEESSQFTFESSKVSFADSACSYDSFSSESVKYMVDILKEEAERRRSKIKERIAKIRESTDRVSHTSAYVTSSLASIAAGDGMVD